MRASWSTLPHQLRIAGIALLAAWTTVLSWRVLTEDFGEVAHPAAPHRGRPRPVRAPWRAGAGSRGSRSSPASSCSAALLVLGTTTGSPIPTPSNVDTFMAALSRRARDVAQLRRARAVRRPAGAPVAPHRRHARRAAGRPDRLHHAPGPGGRPRAARRLHPAGRGHRRRGVVVALRRDRRPVPHPGLHPAQRPRHQLGPRARRREGLLLGPHRRDRQHGAGARRDRHRARGRRARRRAHDEHERLRGQRTRHPRGRGAGPDGRPAPRPAPRRGHPAAVGHHARARGRPTSASRSSPGSAARSGRPGDREIPESQAATGALPPLDGVALDVPRREFKYDVRVGPDFASTWLPTAAQTTRIAAGNDWRYDLNTRDVIAAREDITTADSTYDYTGVQLDLRRRPDELRGVRCRLGGRDLHRGAEHAQQRDPPARGEHHRGRTHPLPEGAGAAAVVPRGRRLPLRPQRGAVSGRRQRGPPRVPQRPGRLLRAVRGVDGDHGAHHRHPEPGGGRLPRARARHQRLVGVLLARPARVARALLPGIGLGALRAHPPGPHQPAAGLHRGAVRRGHRDAHAERRPPQRGPARARRGGRRRRGRRRQQRLVDPLGADRRRPARPGAWWASCCSRPGWSVRRGAGAASTGTSRTSGSSCATSPSTWATPGRWAARPDAPASGSATCWRRPSTTARDPTARDAVATRPPRRRRPSTGSSRLSSAAATPATPRPSPPTTSPATSSWSRSRSSPG